MKLKWKKCSVAHNTFDGYRYSEYEMAHPYKEDAVSLLKTDWIMFFRGGTPYFVDDFLDR